MQENDGRPARRTGLGIADFEDAGVHLLQRGKGRVRARLDRGLRELGLVRSRLGRTGQSQLGGGKRHGGGAEQPAAVLVNPIVTLGGGHVKSLPYFPMNGPNGMRRAADARTALLVVTPSEAI